MRLRRGPQDAPRDIQVPLAPSGSRRVIPFAATVLRSLALLRYRSHASSHNDLTPLTRLSRALRLRFAFPGSSIEVRLTLTYSRRTSIIFSFQRYAPET